jgi:hypothetical protein
MLESTWLTGPVVGFSRYTNTSALPTVGASDGMKKSVR